MPPASVSTLLSTAIDNLDRLAADHGGPKAVVTPSLVEWSNSGLEIDMSTGPDQSPDRRGGPCRYDELRAAYEGVAAVIGRLGYRKCTIIVERLSSVLRRRVRLVAHGQMTFTTPLPPGRLSAGKFNGVQSRVMRITRDCMRTEVFLPTDVARKRSMLLCFLCRWRLYNSSTSSLVQLRLKEF